MRSILTAALLLATVPAFADQASAPTSAATPSATAPQSLGLSPIINDLSSSTRVATIQVANRTACTGPFQFQVVRWTQKDGLDVEGPTEAVRAVPAVATIPAGGTQIVRIARITPANPGVEETYRLNVSQLKGCAGHIGNGPTLNMNYKLQSPIFYRNPTWKAALKAVWDGSAMKLHNDGKATADIYSVTVDGKPWLVRNLHVQPGATDEIRPKSCLVTKPVPKATSSTKAVGADVKPVIPPCVFPKPSSVVVQTGPKTNVTLTVE